MSSNFRDDNYDFSIRCHKWMVESLHLIKISCSENSDHYRQAKYFNSEYRGTERRHLFDGLLGTLGAAKTDFEHGMFFDVRRFVRAELLDDFLSQAEYLLNEEYHCAAASLAGAVLEDTLRKLCDKNNIEYEKKTRIDALNISLAQKEIYDKTTQKRITLYADIRNNADHGHFGKVKNEDVDDMIKWLTRFIDEHMRT
ncbi:MAG: DUF4145 domain-containing protein [candidate division Zixibacteria bacterium HGW-Zixibacteria-1]|nr:MAG: DUF4145 domain-containing protein [candidate division Zixibacteria bacterium HGW-Zixibacteria-1]